MHSKNTKTAIVLFNLGGPDCLDAVRPFLFNLFYDPAIIRLPNPLRFFLAKWIAGKREKEAKGIYEKMGGRSPILEQTKAQARALEAKLREKGWNAKVYIAMRHWHPRSRDVVSEVKSFQPGNIILLPLYPQFSTTTTASSFREWDREERKAGLNTPTARVCCYPDQRDFIASVVQGVRNIYFEASRYGKPRVLFSAHGLPEKIVKAGDPYPWQVERTVAEVVRILAIDGLDYVTCYQSRVGPLKWIEPYTDKEIIRAGEEKIPVIVVPVSFVSEHSETLVELDMEYRHLAEVHGVPAYYRAPTPGIEEHFITALASLCLGGATRNVCPSQYRGCGCRKNG